jgi:hypothetical protein
VDDCLPQPINSQFAVKHFCGLRVSPPGSISEALAEFNPYSLAAEAGCLKRPAPNPDHLIQFAMHDSAFT